MQLLRKNSQETVILVFMILLVIAGFIIFGWRLWGSKKTEIKESNQEIEEEEQVNPDDPPIITVSELKSKIDNNEDFILVDVQSRENYLTKHIPNSISIPHTEIAERYNELPKDKEIIVTDAGKKEECKACTQVARVLISLGFQNVKDFREGVTGWAERGFPTVSGEEVTFKNIDVDQLLQKINNHEDIMIIDVRDKEDYDAAHIKGAVHIAFEGFLKNTNKLPKQKEVIIYDEIGTRSKLVTKHLVKKGFIQVTNLLDGFKKWKEKNYPVES